MNERVWLTYLQELATQYTSYECQPDSDGRSSSVIDGYFQAHVSCTSLKIISVYNDRVLEAR